MSCAARSSTLPGRELRPLQLPAEAPHELAAVLREVEVEVRLGTAGEVEEEAVRADLLDDGQVDGVVEVRHGLLPRHRPALVYAHEVAVHADVLEEPGVLAGRRDGEVGLRSQLV